MIDRREFLKTFWKIGLIGTSLQYGISPRQVRAAVGVKEMIQMYGSAAGGGTNYLLNANLAAAWYMNNNGGTEVDRGTNSQDLTASSAPPTSATVPSGYSGTSRSFTSSDPDFLVRSDDNGALDIYGADQKLSITAWVRTDNNGADRVVVAKGTSGADRQYYLRYDTVDDAFYGVISDTSSTSTTCVSANGLVNDTWTHIALVYNDVDIRLYRNGSLDSGANNPKAHTAGIADGGGNFRVGSFGGSMHWSGLIDEIAIFNDDLSAAEVLEIYTYGIDGANGGND